MPSIYNEGRRDRQEKGGNNRSNNLGCSQRHHVFLLQKADLIDSVKLSSNPEANKKETKLAQTAALRRVKFTVFPLEKAIMRQAKTANTKVDATTPKI